MTAAPHWYPGITDNEAQVEVPDGRGPGGEEYLAHGWVDGVGRFAWGHTVEDARTRWLALRAELLAQRGRGR